MAATAQTAKKKPEAKKLPAFKVTISGTYRNSKKEVFDFEGVTGYIPYVEDEVATAAVIKRYAYMWVKEHKDTKERLATIREVFVDDMEQTEYAFSYVGKNIKEMSYEELQDLATAKELRAIPLWKKGGLRQARVVAYAEYSEKLLGREIDYKKEGFNFAKLPALLADGTTERNVAKTFSNDEILDMEQDNTSTGKPNFSREELEQMANEKGITFNAAITDEKLYQKVFNG